jgi:hypothetical protein
LLNLCPRISNVIYGIPDIIALPEFSKGWHNSIVCCSNCLGNYAAVCIIALECRNHCLVHSLKQWGCVWGKEHHFNFWKYVTQRLRMNWCIVQ